MLDFVTVMQMSKVNHEKGYLEENVSRAMGQNSLTP